MHVLETRWGMKINLGKKQIVIDGILTDMEQNRIIKQNTSRNNNKKWTWTSNQMKEKNFCHSLAPRRRRRTGNALHESIWMKPAFSLMNPREW